MKRRIFTLAFLAGALACGAGAQSAADAQWIGVWEGKLDGQPRVTLTLAKDTGELGGTLVLNMIRKDKDGQAHVAASEPHVLLYPRLNQNTLAFEVKKIDGAGEMRDFTVVLTAEGKARIHCMNCGADAPVVDIERQW